MVLVTGQGYTPSEAVRSLGIEDDLVRRWTRKFEQSASGGGSATMIVRAEAAAQRSPPAAPGEGDF